MLAPGLSRRWLGAVFAGALVLCLGQSPGLISPDTKLDITINPLRFLTRAATLWNSDLPFGQTQNQSYGYLFPHGAFFLLGDVLGLPGWVIQRLWWAVLLTAGVWGVVRVAEALGVGTTTSRLIGAGAYALCPRVLATVGSISSETLPMMLAPWVLLPVVLAFNNAVFNNAAFNNAAVPPRTLRILAAQSGLALALMGAVNAVATLAACIPAVLWWACHRPTRRWWRFTGWWGLAAVLAVAWWVVPLVLLGRVSPPFLDFIESSGVTTRWMSLTEVLRGTQSWSTFVSPGASAAASLVTQPVAVLATILVAAAGLAGLVLSSMPARGRLITMLVVGVVLMGVGYSGGLGSPLAHMVQEFLDAAGAPLRNVHKVDPVVRIPLVLGMVHLLGRIPLPGSAPRSVWIPAMIHPERDKRMAVGIVVLTAVAVATSLAWTGRLTAPGAFRAIPQYWYDAAQWLNEHPWRDGQQVSSAPLGRVLVVPGAPFATQVWGNTRDEPLQALIDIPWGVRDSIPLTPPETIRALDSVQRLFAAGRPSAGLADTLIRQGISYVVVRNDLDPDMSRSARPLLVHRAIEASSGLQKVAQFGDPVGPGTLTGFISDSGLRPQYPAVEIYRIDPASMQISGVTDDNSAPSPGAPYLSNLAEMTRVNGGPEVLLRLNERRRLMGKPALGPVLLAADVQSAGLDVSAENHTIITDTPVNRETDYGRVDDHSSAVRTFDDQRNTYNRVPDYPVAGAAAVHGRWTGARLSASSSSSDATALPHVTPALNPGAAVDGDPATAWVSNSLQPAIGQWLHVDFERPITNATMTITPSATAVGAQVRRIQVETVNGTTSLRFDEPGKPLAVALPYGQTPWVRITAVGTDDGSSGVQFGVTDLSVTQYDASGFAHPVDIRHTVVVPEPSGQSVVDIWDLGSELLGRSGCAAAPDSVQCAAAMTQAAEESVTFSRTMHIPHPVSVTPTVWVRARQGPALADLVAQPATTRSYGDADLIDIAGSAYAATDGDQRTSWTAPQRVVEHRSPPTLTLRLPGATEVAALRLAPSSSVLPTHPTLVAIDLGTGPQVRTVQPGAGVQTIAVRPHITDTITMSLLDWDDVIDRTALGFDQLKPPGLAEVSALRSDGTPIAPAQYDANRLRRIDIGCDKGPIMAIAGRFVRMSVSTTVGALLDSDPIAAQPCDARPIDLATGEQELLISPGSTFIVDGAQLATQPARSTAQATTESVDIVQWSSDHRAIQVPPAAHPRVLTVPESVNTGWVAHFADGLSATPITVNGWQQGWIIPGGHSGLITMSFPANTPYRLSLAIGLGLLPLLLLLAFLPPGRIATPTAPVVPWSAQLWFFPAGLAVGALLAGIYGFVVFGAVFVMSYMLRQRPRLSERVLLGLTCGGLIAAGVGLSRQPWRSVDGYVGHSGWIQLLALTAVGALIASTACWPAGLRRDSQRRKA